MSVQTLAVLAGGLGSRMGRPKGELAVDGVPVLERLLDRLGWPGRTLLVTAPGRERPRGWRRFDAEVVDPVDGQGPLRGIHTALTADGGRIVVVAVDMPNVTRPQLEWLAAAVGDHLAVMTRSAGGQVEPFPAAFGRAARPVIERHLAAGRRSVHGLSREAGVVVADTPADWPASTWLNLNTPADWAAFVAGERRSADGRT